MKYINYVKHMQKKSIPNLFFTWSFYRFIRACVIAQGKKSAWHQKLLYVMTDYCNGKHLTQPPDLNSSKKKQKNRKTELRGKWEISKNH